MPEAKSFIESEVKTLIAFQQEDGTIERWYGDGNWARTLLLYAMWKTQGCFVEGWQRGGEARARCARATACSCLSKGRRAIGGGCASTTRAIAAS